MLVLQLQLQLQVPSACHMHTCVCYHIWFVNRGFPYLCRTTYTRVHVVVWYNKPWSRAKNA